MPWARVDDGWWSHPKVLDLSLEARGLWVTALSWSCSQRRDLVPSRFIAMVADDPDLSAAAAIELVDAGLWEDVDGGYRIHDWAEYQEASLSEKRAEAGRKGGIASGKTRRAQTKGTKQTGSKPEAKKEAKGEAGTQPSPTRPDRSQPETERAEVVAKDRESREDSLPAAKQNGHRNFHYEAVAAALDMPLRGDHEGLFGAIAAKAQAGGHDPEEIFRRAGLHLATFNFPLTPASLKKRWDELGSKVVTATDSERKQAQQYIDRMRRRQQILGEEGNP